MTGAEDPVVQVIDQQRAAPVYTLRINGQTFRPHVFRAGVYTIRVGEGDVLRELVDVQSSPERDSREIAVSL